jgi:hypothetical protein
MSAKIQSIARFNVTVATVEGTRFTQDVAPELVIQRVTELLYRNATTGPLPVVTVAKDPELSFFAPTGENTPLANQ